MLLAWIGIDPGASGALAVLDSEERLVETVRLRRADEPGGMALLIADAIAQTADAYEIACVTIERVAAYPGQGVSSTFAFGRAYGEALGAAVCSRCHVETVPPQRWQRDLSLTSGKGASKVEHKRHLRDTASARFQTRLTLDECDAVWLAYWAKRLGSRRA
jgi:hypothetical protein